MKCIKRSQLPALLGAMMLFWVGGGAQAKSVWVAELEGMSLFVSQSFLLTQGGPSVDGTGDLQSLNLSYQGDSLKILALQDNNWTLSLPFGLGVYPENHIPTHGDQSYLVFVPMVDFPATTGAIVTVPIPTPEPASLLIVSLGLLSVAAVVRRRMKRYDARVGARPVA